MTRISEFTPSYPKLEELKKAADVLGTCVLLAKAESDNRER